MVYEKDTRFPINRTRMKRVIGVPTLITLAASISLRQKRRMDSTAAASTATSSADVVFQHYNHAGTLNEGSFYADHHLTPRLDLFAGIAGSNVSGGLTIAISHGPASPISTPATLLRYLVFASPSDRRGATATRSVNRSL
jgi:hypothetical protein